MTDILVFGKTGQVAQELQRLAPNATYLSRDAADLSDPQACAEAIRTAQPRAVINAAAWTAVDRAETAEAAALVVNGETPAAMARACADLGVPFVQISTDYVFDGTGDQPFPPDHPTAPLGAYGRTKLAGEHGVVAADSLFAILRTSWVVSAHGQNFVKTMLRLGATRPEISVVADQIGGPTPARAIAEACLTIAKALPSAPEKRGIYHFTGEEDVSWADFAREIFRQANLPCRVVDIPTSAYPTPAKRPANSRLNCDSLKTFGLVRPNWRRELTSILCEMGA